MAHKKSGLGFEPPQ